MSDDSQIIIPPTFVALFVPPGRIRPTETREHIAERYEFCEDLASLLVDQSRAILFDLGITESDVLERIHRGLLGDASGVSPAEAQWVVRRLAELNDWAQPDALFRSEG